MAARHRTLFIVLGSIVALVLLVALAIPLFINGDSFRAKIEAELTESLGRKVTIGKLDLSVLSGGLLATNTSLADDPAFSNEPILQAAVVDIDVDMIPLIFSRQVHITGFSIKKPTINLIRHANGTWNYSTIGGAQANKPSSSSNSMTGLIISHVTVSDGTLHVSTESAPGSPATPKRTYDQLNIEAKNFAFDKQFPFTVSAHLPADGTVSLAGNAGPINQRDASLTPFGAKLEVKHLDPVAAGFLDASSGISGTIDAIDVESTWNGQQLHVNSLLIDTPKLSIVRKTPPSSAAAPKAPNSSDMLSTLSADRLQVKNGILTLNTPGEPKPAVYQQLNAAITNLSPTTSSPFKLTALVPGGGSVTADGTAGPLNQDFPAATPLNAHATLTHIDLASSGIIAPDAGISGLANVDLRAVSDGKNLNANISANAENLRLAANGSPSTKPVKLQMSLAQSIQSLTGQIQKAVVTVGSAAAINIAGNYQTSGPTTAINLKLAGNSVPIDEIEAFLPSVGVHLPTGSRLQGGTLTANLDVTGSTAQPIIAGPISLNNTNLTGFDLGSKLSAVTALTGAKTGSVTAIRSLKTNIRVAGGNVRTDNLALDVPALGTATGAGTVAATGALNYNVILKLTGLLGSGNGGSSAAGVGGLAGSLLGLIPNSGAAGAAGSFATSALRNGVPVAIGGTTSNPTFTPNLSGAAISGASAFTGGKTPSQGKQSTTDSLTNALGGLLGGKR